jgi:hypothetical protein
MSRHLRLAEMHERHWALTPAIAGGYEEAASVCLSRHHSPPVELTLTDNGSDMPGDVGWTPPDQRVLDAWANETDTTEAGAYGFVIAGIEELRGLFAVRRAETGTGADYYVGPPGAGVSDLEDCVRLEISGVASGDGKDVARRVLAKVRQAREGASSLPAVAGVAGFAARLLVLKDVTELP